MLAFDALWPESYKRYGHGNEVFSLCSDYKGSLVASSCRVILKSVSVFFSLIISDQTMARLVMNSCQRLKQTKRIIWACSWNPFGNQIATSSRDQIVKIWSIEKDARVKQVLALPQFGSSVTGHSRSLDRNRPQGEEQVHCVWDEELTYRAVENKDQRNRGSYNRNSISCFEARTIHVSCLCHEPVPMETNRKAMILT